MPQGRRKTPFSGKLKKQQLLTKRQTKKLSNHQDGGESTTDESDAACVATQPIADANIMKINFQPSISRRNANRYALQFHRETVKELKAMKEAARKPIEFKMRSALEMGCDYFDGYDFPVRPKWNYTMSKEQLDRNENRYFTDYVMQLEKTHAGAGKTLSYCELNLETWRQLWRVLEISDIILVIADVRYPALMFPPSLFEYVTNDLSKHMILVLNKIDLVPSHVVLAWKCYFEDKYKNIRVILFTSYPSYNLRMSTENRGASSSSGGELKILRRRGKMRMAKEGAYQIMQACKSIVKDAVDLSSWENKIIQEIKSAHNDENSHDVVLCRPMIDELHDFDFEEHVLYGNGILTVGCVGFPNVGKSSLMNALMGRKVVSVSKTPGHTKHFQTIFLTNNVRLCDCPGLVFPSSVPRNIQVLIGSYPIAQLREPFASVQYLAERIDLIKTLNIKVDGLWSAAEICDAWALKKGFLTAKTGRPDNSRAANSILRMTLAGQITLALFPPDFVSNEEFWKNHDGVTSVEAIKALGISDDLVEVEETLDSESDIDDDSKDEDSDNEDNSEEDTPEVKNAFAVLNVDED